VPPVTRLSVITLSIMSRNDSPLGEISLLFGNYRQACRRINLIAVSGRLDGWSRQTGVHMERRQEHAFEEFVGRAGDGLLRLATLLASDQGLGEDAYQETLHRLAARWGRIDNPEAYSRRVLHNVIIDEARARQRRPVEVSLASGHDNGDPRTADQEAAVEIRPVLLSALRALAPQQRAVVVLRYFDDRSEGEVADLLGVTVGTVKSAASRAMAHLREHPALGALVPEPLTATDPDAQRRVRYA
jgi:RNA polymerase sigma-70 factor (sigma-E family)